jgi:hypothetical protein
VKALRHVLVVFHEQQPRPRRDARALDVLTQLLDDALDVDAEFVINRKDFGVVYPGIPDELIKDDVLSKLPIHAKKAGEQRSAL